MSWGAVAGAAIGAVGSYIGGKGSKKAAKQQARASQAAIETQEKYLSPYAQAGEAALGDLQNFVNQGANYADTQAFKDITNSARAAGMGLSGNRLTALTDYYANNFRPQRMNELGFIPQLGANAAGALAAGIGGLQLNIGDAQAGGTMGQANAWGSGLGAIGSALGGVNFSDIYKRNNLSFLNPSNSEFVGQPDPRRG